jgi:site-specific recombinase XerD
MMSTPGLGPILYSFFEDHLKSQKGFRPTSVKSYRDALKLFLHFVAKENRCKITRLTLSDLTCERVLQFLKSLEEERHNHIRTRNQRLAAFRTFFEYLANRVPEALSEAERVAAIPTKRVPPPETFFLERDEICTVFRNLSSEGPRALRDRALLLFLYNTGARVQEVADLRVEHLDLGSQPRVHLHGKGGKWRVCPLWPETASLLRRLLGERRADHTPTRPVFTSSHERPLTRFGIYKIVRRHTQHLTKKRSDTTPLSISPHIFRHSTAVHLLEAGVEVNVIRAWLGHVSLDTTNRYAEINIRMKEAALQVCEAPIASEGFPRKPVWRDDPSLLKWLESL